MKTEARARGGYKFEIGAAGEDNLRDRSPARRMSQADVVAGAELRQIAIAKPVPSPDGEFHFAAVDESERG